MRRRIEGVKTALLLLLVATSLVLAGRLWFFSPPLTAVAPPLRSYSVEGSDAEIAPASLVLPRAVLLYRAGEGVYRTGNPGAPLFVTGWRSVREALARSLEGEAPLPPLDPAALERGRREGSGFELILPGPLPLSFWGRSWGLVPSEAAEEWGGPDPSVRRIALLSADGATLLHLIGDGGGSTLRLAESAALAPANAVPEAPAARPLTLPIAGVEPAPGLYVPAVPPALSPYRFQPEPIGGGDLAAAIFPDMSVVRRIETRDGRTLYTDGAQSLTVYPSGAVAYRSPASRVERPVTERPDPIGALEAAATFVGDRGGWPAGTFLLAIEPAVARGSLDLKGGEYRLTGYRLTFSFRQGGVPVLGGLPPLEEPDLPRQGVGGPIELRLDAESRVEAYNRLVPVAAFRDAPRRLIPPEEALRALGRIAEERSAEPVRVLDLFPAYFPLYREGEPVSLRPSWAMELADGSLFAVDGLTGTPLPVDEG